MAALSPALVEHLGRTATVTVVTTRPTGERVATPIWSVEVDGVPYIRSAYGPGAAWYRRARSGRAVGFTLADGSVAERDREAALRDEVLPVTVRRIDPEDAVQRRVDEAFLAKYTPAYPKIAPMMVTPEIVGCTLVVES